MRSFCLTRAIFFCRPWRTAANLVAGALFAFLALSALSGCATNPQGSSNPAVTAAGHRAATNASTVAGESGATFVTHAWRGRFFVKYEDQGDSRSVYGNFDWNETSDGAITLQLRSPFGQTLAVITSSPHDATLTLPGRAPLVADNVSSLMENALGFSLPIEGLRYWLRAEHENGYATVKLVPQYPNRITQIIQNGWTIDYAPYADTSAADGGVKRMNMSRTDPPLEIRLVLDR